jgi:hypothetical protein
MASKLDLLKKISESPGEVEEGLTILDRDVKIADYGSIDMIGADHLKRLVIVAVGLDDSPQVIMDSVGHLDWVVRNEDIVSRLYSGDKVNHAATPRVFVMVPRLSDRLLRISSYFAGMELDLFEYKYIASIDSLVVEKSEKSLITSAEMTSEVSGITGSLYGQLKEALNRIFEKIETFEIGPLTLLTLGDRLLAKVSFTEDFLIIDMPPDGILEIKDQSGLDNALSVLRSRAERFGVAEKRNPTGDASELPSLTEQELEALGGEMEEKESDATYQAEAATE